MPVDWSQIGTLIIATSLIQFTNGFLRRRALWLRLTRTSRSIIKTAKDPS
jgi:hypothetical protein